MLFYRADCVEVVWTHGENGGVPAGEKNSRIRCKKCEVKNVMDGLCEKSIEGARKDNCEWRAMGNA